jgi:uncharacterized membrane protein YcaP (DUF421 family)
MNLTHDLLSVVDIVVRTTVVYLFLIGGILLFGKKELAQLSIMDLVFILLISNSVQNAMVGPSNSLAGGLVSAGMLFILNFTLKKVTYKSTKIDHFIEGDPVMLIYQGVVQQSNLEKQGINLDELEAAAREHGVEKLNDVKLAMLENDGNISIVTFDKSTTSHYKRKKRVPQRLIKNG